MLIKRGYICVASLDDGDNVFFGKGASVHEAYSDIRLSDLSFFETKSEARSVSRILACQAEFSNVFCGRICLKIAETYEEIESFEQKKWAQFVVIARNFVGPDLVGRWAKNTAAWSVQGGNSLRHNGMRPFTKHWKALDCMMQTCRQQDGQERSFMAIYSFSRLV